MNADPETLIAAVRKYAKTLLHWIPSLPTCETVINEASCSVLVVVAVIIYLKGHSAFSRFASAKSPLFSPHKSTHICDFPYFKDG